MSTYLSLLVSQYEYPPFAANFQLTFEMIIIAIPLFHLDPFLPPDLFRWTSYYLRFGICTWKKTAQVLAKGVFSGVC